MLKSFGSLELENNFSFSLWFIKPVTVTCSFQPVLNPGLLTCQNDKFIPYVRWFELVLSFHSSNVTVNRTQDKYICNFFAMGSDVYPSIQSSKIKEPGLTKHCQKAALKPVKGVYVASTCVRRKLSCLLFKTKHTSHQLRETIFIWVARR